MNEGIVEKLPSTLVVPAAVIGLTVVVTALVWGTGELVVPLFVGGAEPGLSSGLGAPAAASMVTGAWSGPVGALLLG